MNFERALRLSPIDPMNFNNYVGIASAHEVAQEYDKAAAFYQRALEERPNASWIYRNLASSYPEPAGSKKPSKPLRRYAQLSRSDHFKIQASHGVFPCRPEPYGRKSAQTRVT